MLTAHVYLFRGECMKRGSATEMTPRYDAIASAYYTLAQDAIEYRDEGRIHRARRRAEKARKLIAAFGIHRVEYRRQLERKRKRKAGA